MFEVEGVSHMYSRINCPSIVEFVNVLAIEGATYIY